MLTYKNVASRICMRTHFLPACQITYMFLDLERFEMWLRKMENISCSERVRNEVSYRVKGKRNILQTIKIWSVNWTGHILRRICPLKYVIEGQIVRSRGVTERRGSRRKQLLNGMKEKRGYWNLNKEALNHTRWYIRLREKLRISRKSGRRSKEFLKIGNKYCIVLYLMLSP